MASGLCCFTFIFYVIHSKTWKNSLTTDTFFFKAVVLNLGYWTHEWSLFKCKALCVTFLFDWKQPFRFFFFCSKLLFGCCRGIKVFHLLWSQNKSFICRKWQSLKKALNLLNSTCLLSQMSRQILISEYIKPKASSWS